MDDAIDADGREPIHVVHADDDADFLELTKAAIERDFPTIRITSETSASAALERVGANDVDCVLLDYRMPEMDGIAFLERVRDLDESLPVVFFTGQGTEEIASEAIRAGVTDYVRKEASASRFTVLGNRIITLVLKRRAEQAVADATARELEVYERIDAGFLGLDADYAVTYANERASEVLDVDHDALLEAPLFDAVPGFADSVFETELRRARDTQQPTSVEGYYEPRERWFQLFAYPDAAGLSVFVDDVTDQVVTKQELERIRATLELTESEFSSLRQTLSRPPSPFR
ncbi:response regulator [Halarchaeum sp. CBA1220]|uniref:response regulator n=1 Tax=Halarchaeum sp. CBA1220 TaxID=1853682 RepID=UPI000F3A94D1|nr:response regulator [Halarchaeum sp. CBA1220]QLC34156.1 response regulator [Halarchaeum sp. CBA1220]